MFRSIILSVHHQDVMKFHYMGQAMLESNCLLLVMKMFTLQEVSHVVVSKADSADHKSVLRIRRFYDYAD